MSEQGESLFVKCRRIFRELAELLRVLDDFQAAIERMQGESAQEAATLSALRTERIALEPEVEESRRLAAQRDEIRAEIEALRAERDAILARATAVVVG